MKKITAILLVSLLLFDSCGYFFIYIELSGFFKKEAAEKINEFIPENQLEVISFHKSDLLKTISSLNFINEGEIKINDAFYDICKTEYANDSVYIYCLNDKNESMLEQAFNFYLDNKTNDNSKSTPIHNLISNFIKIALAPVEFNSSYFQSSIKFVTDIQYLIPQFSKEIPSPPPKTV